MKRLLLLAAIISIFNFQFSICSAQSRNTIPGTKVSWSFPGQWKYLSTTRIDDNTQTHLFCYKEHPVIANGDTALPYLTVYVRTNYAKPVSDLVFERFMTKPYETLDNYTTGPGLPPEGGMGFVGAYIHPQNRKNYQFRMVYFKEGNTAVEFRLETTRATYDQMEQEFEQILNSLQFNKK